MKKHFNYIFLFLIAFVLFYVPANAQKKKKKAKMGYSAEVGNLSYTHPVKSPMIKR